MDVILQKLAEYNQQQKAVCLCVVVSAQGGVPRHAGSKMLVFPDGSSLGTVGGGEVEAAAKAAALEALRTQKPALVSYSLNARDEGALGICGGAMQVYVEPFLARPKLLIIGAGHVGKAVAKLGKFLNFTVVVSDDRAELCTRAEFPEADLLLPMPMAEIPQQLEIDSQTYIVDVSRGSELDTAGLPALLAAQPAYIGVIGSRRRWEATRAGLLENGVREAEIARIKSPVGLNIHAETPEEIAVSILAEIISLRNTAAERTKE
ncbi:MAG TPA: XdhC/CoxI family protein [Anaerolineaceae bacterium]|nr:XdhC/CoxI family protein [Anaerolineaceae bacterium]